MNYAGQRCPFTITRGVIITPATGRRSGA